MSRSPIIRDNLEVCCSSWPICKCIWSHFTFDNDGKYRFIKMHPRMLQLNHKAKQEWGYKMRLDMPKTPSRSTIMVKQINISRTEGECHVLERRMSFSRSFVPLSFLLAFVLEPFSTASINRCIPDASTLQQGDFSERAADANWWEMVDAIASGSRRFTFAFRHHLKRGYYISILPAFLTSLVFSLFARPYDCPVLCLKKMEALFVDIEELDDLNIINNIDDED